MGCDVDTREKDGGEREIQWRRGGEKKGRVRCSGGGKVH